MNLKTTWHKLTAGAATGSCAVLFSLAVIPAAIAQSTAPVQPVGAQAASASEATPLTLKEAAQLAVLKNPEVMARWHAIRAAEFERDAGRGGFFPKVDLNASAGSQRRNNFGQYSSRWGQLSLTQLLYDGFTRQEVSRLDHNVQARLFEFFDISESTALEAARAYYDVLRYRNLVKLAEDNFVEHRAVFAQTDRRVQAKVARAVDLEQISGRLALAEANLLIETANLHDTTARFQRIVGRVPSELMPVPPQLSAQLPADPTAAVDGARTRHPALLASIENMRAANAALASRSGAYQPRFDFRLRRDQGVNQDGPVGSVNTTTAEVLLTWNLFNGGSDRAREREFAEHVNIAKDIRDKTCRDLRQTLLIAFNDVNKLREQIGYLETHEASVAKALGAYRQQFDIGQRSLLDLLDTENELFQARRAVVNARQDQNIAYARAQQAVGTLLRALDLSSMTTGHDEDMAQWRMEGDAAQQCPAEAVTVYTVDKQALTTRALAQTRPVLNAPSTISASPSPNVQLVPAPLAHAGLAKEVRDAIEAWRAAWGRKDIDAYLNAYAPDFKPAGDLTQKAWKAKRRAIIGRADGVAIELSDVSVIADGPDRATATFTQTYRSSSYQDRTRKVMVWTRSKGGWLIQSEIAEPAAAK
ncbi:TolC family outer membrane protein [Caenimonas koreensis]|uniref:TolC family outer membrane protein n=1 Tax=Caenimonas koreensis DSM 17982 TaxID=1121255 RepID=A0A844B454_9BURK|nr:TolC family outer membrane protein [Caenimonas koreensis]MRD46036.1 TolC family outer membrane protein [Caenimonas koreensis DSM 17982]